MHVDRPTVRSDVTAGDIEVAVLGQVSVSCLPHAFRRAAARELVVYLAFHRQGVRHAEWSLALWPDRPVSLTTVYSTASDARRALGHTADGERRLPCGTILRLHPSVATDVDRFAALSRSQTYESWIEAARLLRGPVFGGLRRADWAVLEGIQATVEAMVVHTVLQAAEAFRRSGRTAEAEWIVRRGLLAIPYDEALYRALLLTLAARGDRAGMRAVMARSRVGTSGARAISPEGGGDRSEGLGLGTAELCQDLLRRWPAPRGAPARL